MAPERGANVGRITRRGFVAATAGALSGLITAGGAGAADRGYAGAGAPHGTLHRAVRAMADTAPSPAGGRAFRGVWLATVVNRDWPSRPGLSATDQRAELLAHLDKAVERRLNAVVFQVRPTADALWDSPYEPWSQWLTGVQGKDPGWDPLGTAVDEAHRRGLALHAWFNPYRVANHIDPTRLVATHPARVHPGWVVPYGGKLYYNPGLPEVRRFVEDAMLDAVARYDVDGVHWDDYFYPYPVAGVSFDDDEAYARYGAGFADRADWRRHNIDLLVRETAARIKAVKPHVRFGVSPFGVWRNDANDPLGSATTAGAQTYDDLYADTRRWVREALIDYICPQLYWNIGLAAADYAVLVPWWDEVARGTGVDLYIGEALYKAGDPAQPAAWQDPAELSRHLTLAKRYPSVRGHCFFAAKEVTEDRAGAMARVVADHYATRAALV
ncbi:glycoside hydrolase family 10 protein [Streptomyces sp. NBC_00083]|uniref:glycoside hydrolase family 10 protein n=1 Tax=Streptomyces sp. NBC_00083 TaxID=2975647 RepID=UPI002256FC26|nr:family 10 glycosylhydrolase [Streptomyces sp. NBC_00083]MCX5383484.1 family 10 glycosylhydrolase [Streptomyces sp. NBC_00083]